MSMNSPNDFVLVTGATGFTGGALARRLREQGYRVRAFVRDANRAQELERLGMELVEGDMRDAAAVDRAVAGCRHVYNIAAVYRTAGHPDSYYHEVNVAAVESLLNAARRHGVERTVHCSTVGVHGHVSRIPSDETAPYNPGDIYQETKLAGEKIAQAAIQAGQPVAVVRPAGIYGPGDIRFLKLFRSVLSGRFRMFGSGEVPYHLTYIDDLVDGIVLCGEHPAAVGEIFIVCGDEYVTLNELVRLVAQAVGVKPPKGHLPLRPLLAAARVCETVCKPLRIEPPLHMRRCEFFIKARAFSNAKARRLLGYQPRVTVDEGTRRTADWYFEHKLLNRSGSRMRAPRD